MLQQEWHETGWAPVDLKRYLDKGGIEPPTMLKRGDGKALIYPGKVHSLYGPPEAGKGWLVHHAVRERIAAHERVLYVDFEDEPLSAIARQRALRSSDADISRYLLYVHQPVTAFGPAGEADLDRYLADGDLPNLAILDGITEAFALHGLEINSNTDAAEWLRLLPRRLARFGVAVLQVDHTPKRDRTGQIGAQHKRAGGDVAWSLESVRGFAPGRDGMSRLTCRKDRLGQLGGGHDRVEAEVQYLSRSDGTVDVVLQPPSKRPAYSLPAEGMERVSLFVEKHEGASQKMIRDGVTGNRDDVREWLGLLVARGEIVNENESSAGRAHAYRVVKRFRAKEHEDAH